MISCLERAKFFLSKFKHHSLEQFSTTLNINADAYAHLALASDSELARLVAVNLFPEPNIALREQISTLDVKRTWIKELAGYLNGGCEPASKSIGN